MARGGLTYEARYVGEGLDALVTEATLHATHELCRSIVEEAREVMWTTAQAATPSRTGAVRASWLPQPIWPHGPERWEARVTNDHWLAHLLNYGTESHEIRPRGRARGGKRALREGIGPRAGAHVRGIQAAHMTERAVDTVGAVIKDVTYGAQQRFKRDAEMAIERTKQTHLK